MSKREKRALDTTKRITWEGINPITRTTENKKTYNRKKSPRWYNDDSTGIFFVCESVFAYSTAFAAIEPFTSAASGAGLLSSARMAGMDIISSAMRITRIPEIRNHVCTPMTSANAPASISPSGIASDIMLMLNENTRPRHSGAMRS